MNPPLLWAKLSGTPSKKSAPGFPVEKVPAPANENAPLLLKKNGFSTCERRISKPNLRACRLKKFKTAIGSRGNRLCDSRIDICCCNLDPSYHSSAGVVDDSTDSAIQIIGKSGRAETGHH